MNSEYVKRCSSSLMAQGVRSQRALDCHFSTDIMAKLTFVKPNVVGSLRTGFCSSTLKERVQELNLLVHSLVASVKISSVYSL